MLQFQPGPLLCKQIITISSDLDGVVKIWDLSTGICKASFQTPAKEVKQSDVQLIDNRLIFVWFADEKIHVYNVEKEELLHTVDGPLQCVSDIRISGDGSKVPCLAADTIHAWSIHTEEVVHKMYHQMIGIKSLIVDGSRAWVYSPWSRIQGWGFEVADSPPLALSSLPSLSFGDTKWWDIGLSSVVDTVTGWVIFKMGGRYTHPFDVQLVSQFSPFHSFFF